MELNERWFVDSKTKRTVLFKGINVAGNAKLPFGLTTHDRNGYWVDYDRKVSFVGKPFPLHEADEHLQRLVNLGFNLFRFVVTWEAIEHEGPGIYDHDYLDYIVKILKKCQAYNIKVLIDPHQDCWSRHCGGSGHPGWTHTLVGLNPLHFNDTNAAIVHNLHAEPNKFPRMIWNTNYTKLAAATMFTLFFAGKTYAPKCIVNGVHVQDYLQDHYIRAFQELAKKIKQEGSLEDDVVLGYDSMNEPGKGYLPIPDLTQYSKDDVDLKVGLTPSAFQGMLLGSGIPTKVDNFQFKWNGPKKVGQVLLDPQNKQAWLTDQELVQTDQLFGWKRADTWPAGCIWAHHGVWSKKTNEILLPNYFATDPNNQDPTDYEAHWLRFTIDYANGIRAIHENAILFLQAPVLEAPPEIPGSLKRLVFTPHWYDGMTLVKRQWLNYNIDFINLNRGKYGTGPFRLVRALCVGEKSIRQCFVDQLKTIRDEGFEKVGAYPCLIGEIGIPYDMDKEKEKEEKSRLSTATTMSIWMQCWSWFLSLFLGKRGYYGALSSDKIAQSGSSQNRAMDANLNALEQNLLSYTLWNYTPDNCDKWGDNWNGEDLSIWQYPDSQQLLLSDIGGHATVTGSSAVSSSTAVGTVNDKTASDGDKKPYWTAGITAAEDQYLDKISNSSTDFLAIAQQDLLEQQQKQQLRDSNQVDNARDIISIYRPHARFTCGQPLSIHYVSPTEKGTSALFEYTMQYSAECLGATEVYVPSRYFPVPSSEDNPDSAATIVTTSAGAWKVNSVNEQFWMLLWTITEGDNVNAQAVKLTLHGILATAST